LVQLQHNVAGLRRTIADVSAELASRFDAAGSDRLPCRGGSLVRTRREPLVVAFEVGSSILDNNDGDPFTP
jgi:hypothetical protein